jgi:phosphohistidine swiveling domain-containing protein
MKLIDQLDGSSGADLLGGKAGSLAFLHGKGFPIPKGFVIRPNAFEACLSDTIRRDLAAANDATRFQSILEQITPTPALRRAVDQALAELCPAGERVAVRSSAMEEDGLAFSYAGQLESFLMVPPEDVVEKVVSVWKSAFSEQVQIYRRQHRIPGAPRPPAVLIQRMVQAQAAGVAFGVDPISGRQDIAVVSAVHGLGSALVNGERDADTWHVNLSNEIVQRQLAKRAPVLLDGEFTSQPALDDTQVQAVARLVRRAGEIIGRPQDVEWAFEKDCLYVLQSRPITAIGAPEVLNIWDNSNIIESYSGVTLPLTFSFATRAYAGVYRQFCQILAVPRAKIASHDQTFRQMLGLIRGRVYYNLLNWYRILALLPGFTVNRRFMEQMMGVKEELPADILAELRNASLGARVKDAIDVAFSLGALAVNHLLLPRKIRRFYQRLNDALAPTPRPLSAMNSEELCAYFLELERKLLTGWDAPLLNDFFAMIFYGVLRRLTANWIGDTKGTLQNELLCSTGGMVSAEPAERIRELAAIARTNPHWVNQLCEGSLPAILSAMDAVPQFKSAYLDYLAKFGDRCIAELKLETLTLHDDPMLLLRSVGQLARRDSLEAGHSAPMTSQDVGHDAEARVHRTLTHHGFRRALFHWVLRHTRNRVRDRENLRFERTRLFGRVRRVFIELGRRLHAAGHLAEPRDVFFLELDEVLGIVSGAGPSDLPALIAQRRAEFSEYQSTPPPPNRFTTRGIVNRTTQLTHVPAIGPDHLLSERKGVGCCPGVVRGRVRKVVDPGNAVIQPGEILVAERTDPGWILLFPSVAGLLVERGSLLSHSAIVAREMRLPAIVSIEGLMDWLSDGDPIEMDGSAGIVRKVKPADAISKHAGTRSCSPQEATAAALTSAAS